MAHRDRGGREVGSEFPNRRGAGLTRAKQALTYLFRLAASNHRITRLYIFDWFGGSTPRA